MDKFVNLHVHTDSSALDGLGTKEQRIKYICEELKQPALAITDHGTLSGIYDFINIANEFKIKPLLGIEAYFIDNIKNKSDKNYHIVLIAKNFNGYQTLMYLNFLAHKYGYYKKPRIDKEMLEKYHKNLICLSACAANDIQQALANNNISDAIYRVEWYKNLFGDDFYLEFEPHFEVEELKKNQLKLYALWKKLGLKAVITSDAHYTKPDQADDHRKLIMINTGGKIGKESKLSLSFGRLSNLYLHSRKQIIEEGLKTGFKLNDIEKWCDTTLEVVEKVEEFEIGQKEYIIPPIPEYEGYDLNEILKEKCLEGLRKRKLFNKIYLDRLSFELKIVFNAGFSSYFLVVADIVNWAKKNGIYVGPGRGCYTENAMVLTSEGFKKIKDVQAGDIVFNEDGEEDEVINKFEYEIDNEELYQVEYLYDSKSFNKFECTGDHKQLVYKDGKIFWEETRKLDTSYCLCALADTADNNKYHFIPIKKITKRISGKEKVYDIQIKNKPSFVVGNIITHNSGAGCLISYLLNITEVDPIKHGLQFERFLNPERLGGKTIKFLD